jgi:hypothetical protein
MNPPKKYSLLMTHDGKVFLWDQVHDMEVPGTEVSILKLLSDTCSIYPKGSDEQRLEGLDHMSKLRDIFEQGCIHIDRQIKKFEDPTLGPLPGDSQ